MRLLTMLMTLTACVWSQTPTPDTPVGVAFAAWLTAFNSGDQAKVEAYLAQFEPRHKERVEMMLGLQKQTGGFDVVKQKSVDALRMEALVKERTGGNYAQAEMEIADGKTMEVKSFEVRLVPPPSETAAVETGPVGRMPQQDAVKAVEGKAAEWAKQDKFSGAVLVAGKGAVLLEKAYGKADREKGQDNTVETKFRIGSMNKMFTATAILQLVGEGKVELSAPIGKYLKGYPNSEVASKVTVRHLLTHTGGTGDIFTPEYEQNRKQVGVPKDYIQLFGKRGLEFEPGSRWAYSNYGFILLGAIVESVTGDSYYEYVREKIFLPLGMTGTDSRPEVEVASQISKGYMRGGGGWTGNAETLPLRGTPAGGGYSTVRDLYRFANGLMSGKLMPLELVKEMSSKQAATPRRGDSYGFGMIVGDKPTRFGHGGGAPGMNGELRIYPGSKTIVVVLANLDPPTATQLADYYEQMMPE
jgi:D-alanyl-D-alanine carboxypeptidase